MINVVRDVKGQSSCCYYIGRVLNEIAQYPSVATDCFLDLHYR